MRGVHGIVLCKVPEWTVLSSCELLSSVPAGEHTADAGTLVFRGDPVTMDDSIH